MILVQNFNKACPCVIFPIFATNTLPGSSNEYILPQHFNKHLGPCDSKPCVFFPLHFLLASKMNLQKWKIWWQKQGQNLTLSAKDVKGYFRGKIFIKLYFFPVYTTVFTTDLHS